MKGNGQINLLTSTTMRVESVAHYHERPVIVAFAQLAGAVERSAGEAAARLFAIPEIGFSKARNVSLVTWYTELPGPFQALTALPPDERTAAEAALTSRLLTLIDAADPETRRLLSLALNLPSQDDILVHGDDIVLIRWGFLDEQGTALADWLPDGFVVKAKVATPEPAPQADQDLTGAGLALRPAALPPPQPPTLPSSGAEMAPPPIHVGARSGGVAGALLSVALLLATFLGYMLWPGILAYPAARGLLDDAQAKQALRGSNAATLEEIKRLRAALSANVCIADRAALRDLGGLPVLPGRTPAPEEAREAPGGQPSPSATAPGQPTPAPAAPAGRQTEGSLLEKLDKGTVLVVGQTAKGVSMGTGILIAPDRVLTNYHVVEKVTGKVSISNQHTGGLVTARVLAHTPNSNFGNGDFALLGLDRPLDLPRMPFASTVERLDSVVAAGYPSFVMSSDPGFTAAIRGGDTNRLGEVLMAVTRGEITTKQPGRNGITVLAHSATTSPGNSGGPLVDACGRVVGVNTYIRSDSSISLRLNYALSAQDAVSFLKENNMEVTPETAPCAPAIAAAPASPVPAPPAAENNARPPAGANQRPPAPTPGQAPAAPAIPDSPASPSAPPARSSIEGPLLDRIERGTVFVARHNDLLATGVLIAPARVIAILNDSTVDMTLQVNNFHMKTPVSARVLARLPVDPQRHEAHLALLGLEHPVDLPRLPFATPTVGNSVVSAGYTHWRFLPELEWSRGEIVADRPSSDPGIATINYKGWVGKPGGPLLDACGRVAGITYYSFFWNRDKPRIHNAIPSRDVIAFLQRNGVGLSSDAAPCQRLAMQGFPPDGSLYLSAQGERKFSTRGSGQ